MPPEPFNPPENEYEDRENDDVSRDANATDETPSATDPKAMARVKHLKKFQQQQNADFWKGALSHEIGRRNLWDWLAAMGTFEEVISKGMGVPDIYATGFFAGQKAGGMRMFLTWMRYDYLAVHEMLKENHQDFMTRKPRRAAKEEEHG